MLRISVTTHTDDTTLTLEGRVVGVWVDELATSWERLLLSATRPIRVNLDGVTFIDDGAKAMLRVMHADGAVLAATTLTMRALVDEIVADVVRDRVSARSPVAVKDERTKEEHHGVCDHTRRD